MSAILALDLGTTTGWAMRRGGLILSGVAEFKPGRFEGGGMRYLRFTRWLDEMATEPLAGIWFEEVRRHVATDAAHVYGGLMATLTAWCELRGIPYAGVPVGTIKKHATGKGNANKGAMVAAARARGFSPADDNEADALALLHWVIETQASDTWQHVGDVAQLIVSRAKTCHEKDGPGGAPTPTRGLTIDANSGGSRDGC